MTSGARKRTDTDNHRSPSPLSSDRCPRADKWFGRCEFEARYDVHSGGQCPTPEQIAALGEEIIFSDDMVRAVACIVGAKTTYVRDVCVRCGKTIERENSP